MPTSRATGRGARRCRPCRGRAPIRSASPSRSRRSSGRATRRAGCPRGPRRSWRCRPDRRSAAADAPADASLTVSASGSTSGEKKGRGTPALELLDEAVHALEDQRRAKPLERVCAHRALEVRHPGGGFDAPARRRRRSPGRLARRAAGWRRTSRRRCEPRPNQVGSGRRAGGRERREAARAEGFAGASPRSSARPRPPRQPAAGLRGPRPGSRRRLDRSARPPAGLGPSPSLHPRSATAAILNVSRLGTQLPPERELAWSRSYHGRSPAAEIARSPAAWERLAKNWLLEVIERSPLDEVDDLPLGWISHEAAPLIAEILGLLSDPGAARELRLSPAALERAAIAGSRTRPRGAREAVAGRVRRAPDRS